MCAFAPLMPNMKNEAMQQILDSVYDFICTYTQKHGFSPSQTEIAQGCYVGRTSLTRYLDKLEAQGHIQRELGKNRSINITDSRCPSLTKTDINVG